MNIPHAMLSCLKRILEILYSKKEMHVNQRKKFNRKFKNISDPLQTCDTANSIVLDDLILASSEVKIYWCLFGG